MADIIDHPNLNGEARGEQPQRSAKILPLNQITKVDLDPDRCLEANKGKFQGLIWAGFDHDGEVACGSTYADGGTVLWLIEILKRRLMAHLDEE